jgi:hypothetical protein
VQIHQLLQPEFDEAELESMDPVQLKQELCTRLGNALEPPRELASLFDYYSSVNAILRDAHAQARARTQRPT